MGRSTLTRLNLSDALAAGPPMHAIQQLQCAPLQCRYDPMPLRNAGWLSVNCQQYEIHYAVVLLLSDRKNNRAAKQDGPEV